MKALTLREKEIAAEMRTLASADSRLGFHSEAESHQYHPAKLAWRLGELDQTLADIARIDAALARGEAYPESDFEKKAPSCKVGGEWTEGKNLRFRVEEAPGGDLTIVVQTTAPAVSIYTFDMAGIQWQHGVQIESNGAITSPLAGNAVTPGHVATGTVTREGKTFTYKLTLGAIGWNNDTRLRPAWLQLRFGRNVAWPLLPAASHRLNLGNVQADRFGRLVR